MSDTQKQDPIEAYCVSCKEKVEIEAPQAVWTSKGQAATRGTCPVCGTNVFRMGRTYLHGDSKAPEPVSVFPSGVKAKSARAAYIAAAVTDAEFAQKLADELQKMGIYTWLDNGETNAEAESVAWSSGVHPALEQCQYLIVVLSGFTEQTSSVQKAWEHFLEKRKPVFVVQAENGIEPPDALRSRPRYDLMSDYKSGFRGLMSELSK